MKTGIVDVGGGMRGAYTAGIYDFLLDEGIVPEYCIGVSAGSANLITFLAGQRGRNLRSYMQYALRRAYMSVSNFVRSGSYVNLDYIYSTLSNSDGEDPLDYAAFAASPCIYVAVATDALAGMPHYFTRSDVQQDQYDILKASCALPLACKPYTIGGHPYFDGGISDPVPWEKALADGCERIIALLTRPRDYRRPPLQHRLASRWALRRYPKTMEALLQRHTRYNAALDTLEGMEQDGAALLLAPADISGMKTLTRNTQAIRRLYDMGYADGRKIPEFLGR